MKFHTKKQIHFASILLGYALILAPTSILGQSPQNSTTPSVPVQSEPLTPTPDKPTPDKPRPAPKNSLALPDDATLEEIQQLRKRFGSISLFDNSQQQADANSTFDEHLQQLITNNPLQTMRPTTQLQMPHLPVTAKDPINCLRRAAAVMEEQAALMETHRLYDHADMLRKQALTLWQAARKKDPLP